MPKKKLKRFAVYPGTGAIPNQEEIRCGQILLDYFRSDIDCIPSQSSFKSPDFLVLRLNQRWEVKTIRGNSDNTIHHAFERSNGQSENLIIFLSKKTKMHTRSAVGRVKRELKLTPKKRVLVVTYNGKIIAIKP